MPLDSRLISLKNAIKEDWLSLEVAENEEGLVVKVKKAARFFEKNGAEKAKSGGKQGSQNMLPAA